MKRISLCLAPAALGVGSGLSTLLAHADAFTYHGILRDAGEGANGKYEMKLTLSSTCRPAPIRHSLQQQHALG